MKKLTLQPLPIKLAICRLEKHESIPSWAFENDFFSITKTDNELSIVCIENHVPPDVKAECDWKPLKVVGPLDFSLTGILSSIIAPLAENKISIFAISTHDTDYILIKETTFEKAIEILKKDFLILN